jgi:EpsD family peptidyl-prolyl cis-trans isomerase
MKRHLIPFALAALAALPLAAQQKAAAEDSNVVAVVNGEKITAAQLDQVWNRMSEKMRAQYEKNSGGKRGFLDNYVRKRLLLQQAVNSGFVKSPKVQAELQAARESALFDLYVRDVLAASVVSDEAVRKFYDEHPKDFVKAERARVRIIFVSSEKRTPSAAREIIANAMQELIAAKSDPEKLPEAFAAAARKYSEHPSAPNGGALGWVERSALEPKVADAAFTMRRQTVSGIIEDTDGMHLLLVEEREPESTVSFEDARAGIREFLMNTNAQKVLEAINQKTAELRASSKVTIYADNVR